MVGGLAPPAAEDEAKAVREANQGVIFVLENAQLETAQVGKVSRWLQVHGGTVNLPAAVSTRRP